jgi:hypothetical protein
MFCPVFFRCGGLVFVQGFLRKRGRKRGVLWSVCGEMRGKAGERMYVFARAEIYAAFSDLF